MARRPGIRQIAEELGVSTTTVHYALRGGGTISELTREQVREVARRLGYRPNRLASGLRLQHSATLGVIFFSLERTFIARVLEDIESSAHAAGYSPLVGCSYEDPQKERELVELFLEKAVDGLIVMPADPEENADFYRQLLQENVPLVFADRCLPGVDVTLVASDNRRGGYLAGQHLTGLGRREIVFVSTTWRTHRGTAVQERLAGCREALAEAGLDLVEVLAPTAGDTRAEEDFAYEEMRAHLAAGRGLDGLFAANDRVAYAAIGALVDAGRRVPEDVSVIGFGHLALTPYLRPALTTLVQPMAQIGQEAVRRLLERIESPEPLPAERILLEPSLVVRQSCGGASRDTI